MTNAHLTMQPIPWDTSTWGVSPADDGAGAVVMFQGVVRGDRHGERRVQALWYDAYDSMAGHVLDGLIIEAHRRWPLRGVRVQHRLGLIRVGEISVVIVVASAHRDAAYAASRFLIEAVKHDVPIWKRTQYDDGTQMWSSSCGAVVEETHAVV